MPLCAPEVLNQAVCHLCFWFWVLHCNIKYPHRGADTEANGGREMERKLAGLSVSVVNWHFSLLSFSVSLSLSVFLPPSLSVSWPSGRSICLLSLSDLSFTMTRAIQQRTHTHIECQAAGAAVCKHSSISHISSLQQEKQSKTPQHICIHTHTAHLLIALTIFSCHSVL